MTIEHDRIDCHKVVATVVFGADRLFPSVENVTPSTMQPKLTHSLSDKSSKPKPTAKPADVRGSAALIVSTKLADEAANPKLVARNPKVKQNAAMNK